MPERGPLGLKRPLDIGPLSGEDTVVSVRLEGRAPEVAVELEGEGPGIEEDPPTIVKVIADAIAHETNSFIEFSGSKKWMVSQAPVTVGEDFDHFVVTLYYPDSRISKRNLRSIRNEIQRRTDRAESINIMRV